MNNLDKYYASAKRYEDARQCYFFRIRTGKPDCEKENRGCKECFKATIEWLLQECKEPILTEEEKIIIKNIIKAFEPFGAEVKCIAKYRQGDEPTDYYLNFTYKNDDEFDTFTFNGDELFVGMEVDELYNLEELGL